MSDEVKLNLQQRKLAVAKAVPYIKKDAKVKAGFETYNAVTHDAVVHKLRDALIENGIAIKVSQTKSESVEGETAKGNWKLRYRAWYRVTLINADDPSEAEDIDVEAHADDSGDKAPGKAMSYAEKMVLLKTFYLETGENDESRYGDGDPIKNGNGSKGVKGLEEKLDNGLISDEQKSELYGLAKKHSRTATQMKEILKCFGFESSEEITKDKFDAICKQVEAEGVFAKEG